MDLKEFHKYKWSRSIFTGLEKVSNILFSGKEFRMGKLIWNPKIVVLPFIYRKIMKKKYGNPSFRRSLDFKWIYVIQIDGKSRFLLKVWLILKKIGWPCRELIFGI